MAFDIGINDGIIISSQNRYKPQIGTIGIKDGKIEYVGEARITKFEAKELIDAQGKIVMPGLINGHCHGDMTLARGLGDDLTLLEQNNVFAETNWFYTLMSDEDRYYSRILTYIEAIMSGTTFISENMYWGLGEKSAEAMSRVKIKGALAEDIRENFSEPDIFISDERLKSFGDICRINNIIPVIGGVSEEDFQSKRLKSIKNKIESFNYLQTCHLAENKWRIDLINNKFGCTPVEYLSQCDVLHKGLIGSHVVHVTDDEINKLSEKGVKVVNTPLCEMKIADGIAPIPKLIKAGVTIGLGTDGAMWNNSNDIFREMKGMALLHTINSGIRSIGIRDILDMATINGAKVFGVDKQIGTIEVGKQADIILINANQPHMAPIRYKKHENIASSVVYCATGQDVTDVLINGMHVVQNRRLVTIDVNMVIDKVTEASIKISDKLDLPNFKI